MPAMEEKKKGVNVLNLYPLDSVFYRAYYNKEFDAVIAMYHDQGRIPVKIIGFMDGVNIALGIPIIRTSLDHGTAWGKAGTGKADETAILNSILIASELVQR